MQSDETTNTHRKRLIKHLLISFLFPVPSGSLTSALGVGAFLLHRGRQSRFSCFLISSFGLHVGLMPVPLPAEIPVLVSVSIVVSILTVSTAAMSMPMPRLPVAAGLVAMFLDLSLCQETRGLPPAGAPLVLLVLPIELSINHETNISID